MPAPDTSFPRSLCLAYGPQPALPVAPLAVAELDEQICLPRLHNESLPSAQQFFKLLNSVNQQYVHEFEVWTTTVQALKTQLAEAYAQQDQFRRMTSPESSKTCQSSFYTVGSKSPSRRAPGNGHRAGIPEYEVKDELNNIGHDLQMYGSSEDLEGTASPGSKKKKVLNRLKTSPTIKSPVDHYRITKKIQQTESITSWSPSRASTQSEDPGDYAIMAQRRMALHQKETFVDAVGGVIILLNCLQIGVSSELAREWIGWIFIDAVFTIAFLLELLAKVRLHGCAKIFLSKTSWAWAWFDAITVGLSATEFFLALFRLAGADTMQGKGGPNISMVRIVRLFRLARLVHLLRFPMFKELLMMVQGLNGCMRTLMWSILLLALPLYVIAIVFRETLGQSDQHSKHFRTLGWCWFTVFRCIMGDCTDELGQPIFVKVVQSHGWVYGFLYCGLVALAVFGLFNVIAAIFVENTLAAAKYNDILQRRRRLQDHEIKARLISRLIQLFLEASINSPRFFSQRPVNLERWRSLSPDLQSEGEGVRMLMEDNEHWKISREFFQDVIQNPSVRKLMDDLDVCEEDRIDLFDILDSDASGELELSELVHGMLALRGETRRSDTVACRLLLHSVQDKIGELECLMMDQKRDLVRSSTRKSVEHMSA